LFDEGVRTQRSTIPLTSQLTSPPTCRLSSGAAGGSLATSPPGVVHAWVLS
jgi:hypothetical protein